MHLAKSKPYPSPIEWRWVNLVASNALELKVIQLLQMRYGPVDAKRVLSGPGLVELFRILTEIHTAAQVMANAQNDRVVDEIRVS